MVPVSRQRFTGYSEECGSGAHALSVELAGAPGEAVELAFVAPSSTTVRVLRYVLSAAGKGVARVSS